MRILIAETDHQVARERAEQLCMDGHQAAVALTAHAAGLRLADLPDVLVLCELDSPVQTITVLRALRAGEIPRSDSRVPVLLVGADGDDDATRYYRTGADITLPKASSPLLTAAAESGQQWAAEHLALEMTVLAATAARHINQHLAGTAPVRIALSGGVWSSLAAQSACLSADRP